jgi:heterodisulfide reductase subunit A-like polyferredoxin
MIGVFVCSCGRRSADAWLDKVAAAVEVKRFFGHAGLCGPDGLKLIREKSKKHKLGRLLLAGCAALQSEAYIKTAAKAAGVASGAVFPVLLPRRCSLAVAARMIRQATAGLQLLPVFESRRVALRNEVLVLGGGLAGTEAARHVAAFGYPTTVSEPQVLESLTGSVGNFSARLRGEGGASTRAFGAVVIASDAAPNAACAIPSGLISLPDLEGRIEALSRRDRPRSAALILDLEIDETKASTAEALRVALALRARYRIELTVLLRHVRVSSLGLEKRYDEAREAGINFVKYDGAPKIAASPEGVTIACRDGVAAEDVEISVGIAAVSPHGLRAPAERALGEAAGIGLDGYGRLQENNVHLLPDQTNRLGVFVVGPCRGELDGETILRDARAAALAVHQLLSQKELEVELSHPVVDGDKCVLCLTCIRSCPFKAMRIFDEEKRADCSPEACRRCGICAGECPAKAIELPAYADRIVLARAGA